MAKRKKAALVSVQMTEGVWYRLDSPEITECCHCSLVHSTEYRFYKGRMFWRSHVDHKATRAKRKENGITIVKSKPMTGK
jgi:hypothetical protein